jgi:hypothetical protein
MENINDLMPLSNDWNKERLTQLKNLFPDLFTNEGKLNIKNLKKLLILQAFQKLNAMSFDGLAKVLPKEMHIHQAMPH